MGHGARLGRFLAIYIAVLARVYICRNICTDGGLQPVVAF
jgi:hypothetical protein